MTGSGRSVALIPCLFAAITVAAHIARVREPISCSRVVNVSGDVLLVRGSTSLPLARGEDLYPNDLLISGTGRATLLVSREECFDVYPNSMVRIARRPTLWIDLFDRRITRVKAAMCHESDEGKPRFPTAVIAVRG